MVYFWLFIQTYPAKESLRGRDMRPSPATAEAEVTSAAGGDLEAAGGEVPIAPSASSNVLQAPLSMISLLTWPLLS